MNDTIQLQHHVSCEDTFRLVLCRAEKLHWGTHGPYSRTYATDLWVENGYKYDVDPVARWRDGAWIKTPRASPRKTSA